MTAPAALIFDWDNTLVDSWVCIQEAYNRTFRYFGLREWSMEETQVNVAKSLKDSFPALFGERWLEAKDVFYRSFEEIHLSHLRALPGAESMLQDFAGRGLFLAVVSNKRGAFLRKEAEVLGWSGLFGALVGASDAEADKPAAAPVKMALASSGLVPNSNVWFVGDAAIDIECAVNAGCVPVLMRQHPPRPGEFDTHPPVYTLENCQSLVSLVNELTVPISPI